MESPAKRRKCHRAYIGPRSAHTIHNAAVRYSGTGDFFTIFAIGTASIHGAAPQLVLLYPLPGGSVKEHVDFAGKTH